jgi:hypothetical protein
MVSLELPAADYAFRRLIVRTGALRYTGFMSDFEHTRSMIVRSRVIAKGLAIRDVQRLDKTYRGNKRS